MTKVSTYLLLTMFFSTNHLIGRDGKFAVVWRAATSGPSRKLPRRIVIGVSITDVCREILKFTPTGPGVEADRLSKFSLYLIGQLVYGTTVIFSRQVVIFEQDVRSVYENCKRLPMEIEDYDPATLGEVIAPRKRQRRSKLSIAEMNTEIDIDEVPESKFVHLARPSDITLFEPEPVIWQRPDIFHEEENQPPINFSKDHFINWSDQASLASAKESSQNENSSEKVPAVDQNALDVELPPFPPPEAFVDMNRASFLSLSHHQVVDEGVSQRSSFNNPDHELVNNREPSPMRPSMDQAADGHRSAEETEFKPDIANIGQVSSLRLSFELSPIHEDDARNARPLARRRFAQTMDTNGLTISYESIKKLQQDYSSLLKTKGELSVNIAKQKHPTVEQLLLPYPAYAGNRFPTECRQLYRSRFSNTLTYQQAMTERILAPVNRGPASTQRCYREGSTETSIEKLEDKLLPGVAYCSGTPDRVRIGSCEAEAFTTKVQRADHVLTPGRATVLASPERYGQSLADERQNENSAGIMDLVLLEALSLDADVSLPENGRFRESRSSKFEFARQWARGTNEFERRPSSVQLVDPVYRANESQLSLLSTSGRGVVLSPSLKEKFRSKEGRLIMSSIEGTDRFIALSTIIPPSTTSAKLAATVFFNLLYLIGKDVIEAEQSSAYDEIWIRGCSPQNTTHGESYSAV